MFCKITTCLTASAAVAALLLTTASANAGIVVTPDHIVDGSVSGTLVVIDVPTVPPQTEGGPIWTTGGDIIATAADDGFTTNGVAPFEPYGASPWEPDGTPFGEAVTYGVYPTKNPNVTYNFSFEACGIDIPDGSIINGVYATWNTRGKDGATYGYNEEDANTTVRLHSVQPTDDLVLSWTDDVDVTRNANFNLLFEGPITVTGGDGFVLTVIDNIGNTAHVDAVVIDVTLEPSSLPGDADGDGDVDAADYIMIKTNFGGVPAAGVEPGGDIADGANGPGQDGVVDWYDLQLLAENYSPDVEGGMIPEPATIGLLTFGAMALIRRRRRS